MIASLENQIPWIWLFIAIAFALVEIGVPTFGFIFGTVAALATAVLTLVTPISWPLQLVTFATILLLGLFLLRPRIIARMQTSPTLDSRTDKLIGRRAVVTQVIDPVQGIGRVAVEGEDWAAKSDILIREGSQVVIEGVDGITLKVKEA